MEAFHIACYGNAPYRSSCTGHIVLMVLIPALCIVMLIAVAEFSTPVNKNTDCDALLPRNACLVAWCMHGSMLQSNVNGPSIHSY